jgi:glycosyltransferase involved in cell wall biosynthesis
MKVKKMIFFVVTTPFAANAFLRSHLLALAKNYEVVLCVNCDAYPLLTELSDAVEIIDIGIQRKISLFQDIKVLLQLVKIILSRRPDAIHSLTPKAGLLTMFASWIGGTPIRCHTFTGQVWATRSGLNRFFLKQLDRLIVLFASNIFVDSESQRQLLYRNKIVRAGCIDMLGSGSIAGVDVNRFRPNESVKLKKRKDLGVEVDACVYLFVGRITRDKGIFDLLAAFQKVLGSVPNVELWVQGPDEENLVSTLKLSSEHCDSAIRWFGATSNPEVLMASADILLLPSYREGFGAVVIEAASCRLPSIAYRIDGVTDAIEDGKTGILVDVGNLESLISAMKTLALDKSLRVFLGNQAMDRACRIFDSDAVTDRWVNFYRQELGVQ